MYKSHLQSLLSVLFCYALSWSFAGNGPVPNPALEIKRQQKDFAVFKDGLFRIESKIDRHIAMDSIERVFAATEAEFGSRVLTPIEEYKLYSKCINLIQSGHTQAGPTKAVLKSYVFEAKSLPFDMVMANKKLFVKGYAPESRKSKNAPKSKKKGNDQLPAGAEIVAIDELSIPQWMEKIGQFIGSDEDDPVFEYVVAGQAFDFYRFLATEEHKDRLEIDYVVKNDTIRQSVKLGYPPLKLMMERFKAQEKQQEKDQKDFGKFKFIGDVGYFRFPSFMNGHGGRYSEFLEKSFKKIRKKKSETVVIDVRGNGGGNIQIELLSYFLEKPEVVGTYRIDKRLKWNERKHIKKNEDEFRRYKKNIRQFKRLERKYPGFDGQMVTFPVDTSLIFRGNVIVLTDEGTFSAASLLASQMKTLRGAQIMGTRAGGSYYACNAGTLHFVLPHSKFSFILNPNTCSSTLDPAHIDPSIKDVDVEIVPEYSPKASAYKKNWEAVVKTAIKKAK
jgi:hypothetical protein